MIGQHSHSTHILSTFSQHTPNNLLIGWRTYLTNIVTANYEYIFISLPYFVGPSLRTEWRLFIIPSQEHEVHIPRHIFSPTSFLCSLVKPVAEENRNDSVGLHLAVMCCSRASKCSSKEHISVTFQRRSLCQSGLHALFISRRINGDASYFKNISNQPSISPFYIVLQLPLLRKTQSKCLRFCFHDVRLLKISYIELSVLAEDVFDFKQQLQRWEATTLWYSVRHTFSEHSIHFKISPGAGSAVEAPKLQSDLQTIFKTVKCNSIKWLFHLLKEVTQAEWNSNCFLFVLSVTELVQ